MMLKTDKSSREELNREPISVLGTDLEERIPPKNLKGQQ